MKSLKNLLVIDVEATCWSGQPPENQQSEIIEIGACLIDMQQLVRTDKRSLIVRPERSTVSSFCTQLTGLTQKIVEEKGVSLIDACAVLQRDFKSKNCAWASYGDYDRRQFEKQLSNKDWPFGSRHINVKTLAGFAMNCASEIGMDEALKMMNLPLEGRHHSGADDAWNIAKIFIELTKAMRGKKLTVLDNTL